MTIALLTLALFPAQPADTVVEPQPPDVVVDEGVPAEAEGESQFEAESKKKVIELGDGEHGIQVHIEGDAGGDLDPELLDRLTPDQLSELLLQREKRKAAASSEPPMVATLVPLFFFLCLAFLVGYPVYLRYRKHAHVQETLRLMVEKGTQIPPELLTPATPPRNDVRRGVILVTLGLGLGLALLMLDGHDGAWGIGLIPLFVGIGYVIAGRVERGERNGNGSSRA